MFTAFEYNGSENIRYYLTRKAVRMKDKLPRALGKYKSTSFRKCVCVIYRCYGNMVSNGKGHRGQRRCIIKYCKRRGWVPSVHVHYLYVVGGDAGRAVTLNRRFKYWNL